MNDSANFDAAAYAKLMQQAWSAWTDALRGPAAQAGTEQGVDHMLGALRGYFGLLEGLQTQWAGGGADGHWREALQSAFGAGTPFMQAFGDAGAMAGGGPMAWMTRWQPLLQSMGLDPQRVLGTPAIGLAREHQERAQQLARDVLDYQQQMQRYNQLLARAGKLGVERFESKLAERGEPGRQIESLRALYDLWVDAAEEGFQEVALSPEWREVYGALVDAQMRVRAGVQRQVEQASRDLGMPTRSEVDTLGQRLHDLRRQVRALEARLQQQSAPAAGATPADAPAPGKRPAARRAQPSKRRS